MNQPTFEITLINGANDIRRESHAATRADAWKEAKSIARSEHLNVVRVVELPAPEPTDLEEEQAAERENLVAKAMNTTKHTIAIDTRQGTIRAEVTIEVDGQSVGYTIVPQAIDGEPCDPNTELDQATIDAFTEAADEFAEEEAAERENLAAKTARTNAAIGPQYGTTANGRIDLNLLEVYGLNAAIADLLQTTEELTEQRFRDAIADATKDRDYLTVAALAILAMRTAQ